jgi:hypothetical protein
LAVALWVGCKTSSTRTTDTYSRSLESKSLKLKFLSDYLGSPTEPLDAEYHLVFHDNAQGCVPGSDDYDLQAVVKVRPEDVPAWALGCVRRRLEATPDWVAPLVKGKKGFEVSAQPDSFRCGPEERVIHVHEGVIYRRVNTMG